MSGFTRHRFRYQKKTAQALEIQAYMDSLFLIETLM